MQSVWYGNCHSEREKIVFLMPNLYIISGCNGAGKTTASLTVLPETLQCTEFVNSDAIAKGLSPLNPESAQVAACRLMISRIKNTLATNPILQSKPPWLQRATTVSSSRRKKLATTCICYISGCKAPNLPSSASPSVSKMAGITSRKQSSAAVITQASATFSKCIALWWTTLYSSTIPTFRAKSSPKGTTMRLRSTTMKNLIQ